MGDPGRPVLGLESGAEAVEDFVAGLQAAVDASDADLFNDAFARDVLWGSPFGLVVSGYDEIHAIHTRMFGAAKERQDRGEGAGSRYEIEHARRISDDVALAYVRRYSLAGPAGGSSASTERADPQPGRADAFDELALFVLVRRDDRWWLAAGLHTPDRRREVYG